MLRALLLALTLIALPAAADLEKWIDKQTDKMMDRWHKEKLDAISSKDPKERLEAVDYLSGRSDPASVMALGRALADSEARIREAAASGLWRVEEAAEPARAQLIAALDDADPNVVARAAGALQALGMKEAELVAPRKRVLDSPNASMTAKFLVSRNLVGVEPPLKLLQPTLIYLEHVSRGSRGSISDPQHKNIELAERALERLVKRTNDRTLIAPLKADLKVAHEGQVVLVKTLALYQPKPDLWAQTMVEMLDSNRPGVRHAALGQMRELRQEKDVLLWAPRAAAMLLDPDSSVRSQALWALGAAGGLAATEVEKVVAALNDPKESVRQSAARALGEMGDAKAAVPAATKVRVAAASRDALTKAMDSDADKDVRSEAKGALAKFEGGGAAVVASAAPSAAPAGGGSEAGGMAVLRARKVSFEPTSFFTALRLVDAELVRAFLDAGMSAKEPVLHMGPPMRAMFFAGTACSPSERPTKAATKDIVKLLLERGADVNAADNNGNTTLMEAAGKGCDRETIRMILKAGAKLGATNASGLTAFEAGLWMGHDGLEELIAAGYRLPPAKVKVYTEGYKDRPAALAMIKKATGK